AAGRARPRSASARRGAAARPRPVRAPHLPESVFVGLVSSGVNGKSPRCQRRDAKCAMLANMERLFAWLKRVACMAALALVSITAAHADDLDDFNRAVEAAMSHHRVAAGYLRTGNIELATVEIDGLREAWAKVSTLPRPSVFGDQQRYTGTILQVATQLVGISLVLNLG